MSTAFEAMTEGLPVVRAVPVVNTSGCDLAGLKALVFQVVESAMLFEAIGFKYQPAHPLNRGYRADAERGQGGVRSRGTGGRARGCGKAVVQVDDISLTLC